MRRSKSLLYVNPDNGRELHVEKQAAFGFSERYARQILGNLGILDLEAAVRAQRESFEEPAPAYEAPSPIIQPSPPSLPPVLKPVAIEAPKPIEPQPDPALKIVQNWTGNIGAKEPEERLQLEVLAAAEPELRCAIASKSTMPEVHYTIALRAQTDPEFIAPFLSALRKAEHLGEKAYAEIKRAYLGGTFKDEQIRAAVLQRFPWIAAPQPRLAAPEPVAPPLSVPTERKRYGALLNETLNGMGITGRKLLLRTGYASDYPYIAEVLNPRPDEKMLVKFHRKLGMSPEQVESLARSKGADYTEEQVQHLKEALRGRSAQARKAVTRRKQKR